MQTQTPEKIQLADDQRKRIRNSSTKKGYIVRLEFGRRPRGGRVRPANVFMGVVDAPAREYARTAQARYRDFVVRRSILTVDHLGRVLAEEQV